MDTRAFDAELGWPDFRRLYRYWLSKCEGERLPGRAEIDPADLAELLPRLYLVDVVRAPGGALDFRFRLAGTEHFEINQIELTGLTIAEAFDPARVPGIRAAYSEVVERGQPSVSRRATGAVSNRDHFLYDRLLLPLASDGRTVDMLLGYLHRLPAAP